MSNTIFSYTVDLEIFARILFSLIALRRICEVQISRLGHDLHISVNGRVISRYRESFIFSRNFASKFRGNKNLAKISEFTVIMLHVC